MIDFTGDRKALESLAEPVAALKSRLYDCPVKKEGYTPVPERKKEAFCNSGQVLYVCQAGNFIEKGLPYKGSLRVLKVMLGYEYLWTQVRVKGGAYGCMNNFHRDGECYFVSYRDPNLGQTIEAYRGAADFIAGYEADETTMTKYVIGAVSDLDTPLTAAAMGRRSKECYFQGITYDMLQQAREEVLDTTPEDIRALADYVRAVMDEDCLCVVGNEQKIKEEENIFKTTENLFY